MSTRGKLKNSQEGPAPKLTIALGLLVVSGAVVGFHLWCFSAIRLGWVFHGLEVEPVKGRIPPEVFVLLTVAAFLVENYIVARRCASSSRTGISRTFFFQSFAYLPCLALLPNSYYFGQFKSLPYLTVFIFPLIMGLVVLFRHLLLPDERVDEQSEEVPSRKYLLAVFVLMLAYGCYFSWLTIRRLATLRLGYSDAGLFWEIVRHSANGKLFFTNHYLFTPPRVAHQTFMSLHFQPVLLLLVPFYWLSSGLETLIVVQALLIASGALAVFLLARDELKSEKLGLTLAAVYLLYPPLQNLHFSYYNGFHPVSLAIPLLLFGFLFLKRGNTWAYVLFMLLALCCKENVGLVVFALGIYALFFLKRRRLGAVTAVVGLLWTVTCGRFIIPYFRGKPYPFWEDLYPYLGDQLTHPWKLLGLVFNSRKVIFLLELLAPLGLLALLCPSALLLVIFPLGISLLVENQDPVEGNRWAYYSTLFHNHSLIIPGLFISLVMGVKKVAVWQGRLGGWLAKLRLRAGSDVRSLRAALSGFLLICALWCGFFLGSLPFNIGFILELTESSRRARLIPELRGMVPTDATLVATDFLANHFLDREKMRVLPPGALPDADYVLLDLRDRRLELDLTGRSRERIAGLITSLGGRADCERIFSREGFVLFRKKHAEALPGT